MSENEEKSTQAVFRRPLPFSLSEPQAGIRWEKWIRQFERYMRATDVVKAKQLDLLINLGGDEIEDLLLTFPNDQTEDYEKAKTSLTKKFDPQRNIDFERYTFSTAYQETEESLDDFATRLRKLVTYCEFDKFDNEQAIRLRIIEGCQSVEFRTRVLKEPTTLEQILTMARTEARATTHAKQIQAGKERGVALAHRVTGNFKKKEHQVPVPSKKMDPTCYRWGLEFPHVGACPAMGQKCRKCNRDNHFATMCMSRQFRSERSRTARPRMPSTRYA